MNGENIGKLTTLVDEASGSAAGATTVATLCCSNSRVECQEGARQGCTVVFDKEKSLISENIGKLTTLVAEASGSAAGATTVATLCCSNSRVECQEGARQGCTVVFDKEKSLISENIGKLTPLVDKASGSAAGMHYYIR